MKEKKNISKIAKMAMVSVQENSESINVHASCKIKATAKYTLCDGVVTILSLLLYVADIVTDIILGVKYLNAGYFEWGILKLILCIVPSILIQCISLRWYKVDQTSITLPMALSHFLLFGIVHRYADILNLGVKKSQHADADTHAQNRAMQLQLLFHYQSDVCLLRLFESFLESAPQLLLQLYVMHELDSWHPWTGISALGSLFSLAWGIASYARTMRNSREDKAHITWIGLALQAAWRTGTMVSRIMALLLCASVIHLWFLLAITIHWFGMTLWTIKQKTDLCSTAWEERIYNAVVGVIYCFCFFNIKEGQSRQRAIVFYTVTAAENAACLTIFLRFSQEHTDRLWFNTVAPTLIVAGFLLGHTSQLVYYRWFHPSGPIKLQPSVASPIEENNHQERDAPEEQPGLSFSPVFTTRTLKHMNRKFSGVSLASAVIEPVAVAVVTKVELEIPLENNNPLQGIVPDVEKLEIMEMRDSLIMETTRCRTGKSISDSRLLEITTIPDGARMLKTKSDGHLHVGHFLCSKKSMSTKQSALLTDEIADSKSESSNASVHDYENMVVLNINRTDWGIRHWKSYSDIETSFHDNSVCKERDPLESSITSASSNDSSRFLASSKISMEEAIAQLKSLAVHGHNVYQQPDMNAPKLYEFIWINENENTVAAPVRVCPTSGHNLSIITEVSESNSTSSTRSKSSLVQTVDAIMDKSVCDASIEDEHLTYVEISFLSKLSESSIESDRSVELTPNGSQNNRPARRQFSIIRDKFETKKSSERTKKQEIKFKRVDKENISTMSPDSSIKTDDSASPVRRSVQSLKKQSTLSPESRIFSQSILKY